MVYGKLNTDSNPQIFFNKLQLLYENVIIDRFKL